MKNRALITNQQGFSLIEILIVIALIAVAGTFVTNQLINRLDEGNRSAAGIQINQFKQLLEDYRRYCSIYPTEQQGLDALVAKPTSGPECPNYPAAGFIQGGKLPIDPWGGAYVYLSPDDGKSYTILSYGTDKKEGGEGSAKDISSADL
ncbi:MAG: type II secretion system major pseudopilin GspG [Oligoflexia bacterium]|nr:type II secretion system major pseudopilin GspG [Oligoflexia bacterium]